MSAVRDVVALAPGFLGFEHFGSFPYFARAVGVALSAQLENAGFPGDAMLVVACSTVPAGSLQQRQEALLASLRPALATVGGDQTPRIHLVGHSTGGLDAELLTRLFPLRGGAWTADEQAVRHRIASVVTLAAPLAGTTLANSPLARFLATAHKVTPESTLEWLRTGALWKGPKQLTEVLLDSLDLLRHDRAVKTLLTSARHDLHPMAAFLGSLVFNRNLLADLRTESVHTIMTEAQHDPALTGVHVARFLTVAANEPKPTPAGALFADLYELTAAEAKPEPPLVAVAKLLSEKLASGAIPLISGGPRPFPITVGSSDGVANTVRQIEPFAETALDHALTQVKAVVVADHVDVLGYYTAEGARADEANGFLSSGSEFHDAEFNALYAAIAAELIASIRLHERGTP